MEIGDKVLFKVMDIQKGTSKSGNEMFTVYMILNPGYENVKSRSYLVTKFKDKIEEFLNCIKKTSQDLNSLESIIGSRGWCIVNEEEYNGNKYFRPSKFLMLKPQTEENKHVQNDFIEQKEFDDLPF